MDLLNTGDRFPSIDVNVGGGQTVKLPDALAGDYGVVLLYRGGWCPYCNAQLRAFQQAKDKLADLGVKVVALSVDDEATTRETIARQGLEFPVGYGADARAIAAATGAFVSNGPVYLQSTGFVLDPDGRVLVSVYSSAAVGRLVPEDVVGLVRFERERVAGEQTAGEQAMQSAERAARMP